MLWSCHFNVSAKEDSLSIPQIILVLSWLVRKPTGSGPELGYNWIDANVVVLYVNQFWLIDLSSFKTKFCQTNGFKCHPWPDYHKVPEKMVCGGQVQLLLKLSCEIFLRTEPLKSPPPRGNRSCHACRCARKVEVWVVWVFFAVCCLVFLSERADFYTKSPWRASGWVQHVKPHYAIDVLMVLFLAQLLSLSESSKQPCSGKQADQSIVGQAGAAAALVTKFSCVAADPASSILRFSSPAASLPAPLPCAQGAGLPNRL